MVLFAWFQLLIRNYFLCNRSQTREAGRKTPWFQLLIRNYFLCNCSHDSPHTLWSSARFNCSFAIISSATSAGWGNQADRDSFNCSFAIISSATTSSDALIHLYSVRFNCSFAIISSATPSMCLTIRPSIGCFNCSFAIISSATLISPRSWTLISLVSIAHSQLFPLQPHFVAIERALLVLQFQLLIRNYFLCNMIVCGVVWMAVCGFNCSFAIISSATWYRYGDSGYCDEVSIAHSQLFPLQRTGLAGEWVPCLRVSIAHSQLFPLQPLLR